MSIVSGNYYVYTGKNEEGLYWSVNPGYIIQAGTDEIGMVDILNYKDYKGLRQGNWVFAKDLVPRPFQSCLEV